ncbi:MAG: hypothetical protein AAFU57_18450 [Bacteroidota bacterium]
MINKKIAVVTGVTSGIGKEVALGLVERNYATSLPIPLVTPVTTAIFLFIICIVSLY